MFYYVDILHVGQVRVDGILSHDVPVPGVIVLGPADGQAAAAGSLKQCISRELDLS